MNKDTALLPHGGYRRLRSYRIAEVVYDATVVFCDRFIPRSSRTHDQMVQAARSGVRNISEGSGAAATSKSTEIRLTNVARASLMDELALDYRSFAEQSGLRVWEKDGKLACAMRQRLRCEDAGISAAAPGGTVRLSGLAGLPEFVRSAEPEVAANAMICAINQAGFLLSRQIAALTRQFEREGGFREQLMTRRIAARAGDREAPPSGQGAITTPSDKGRRRRHPD